jgi:Na+/H+-dicarboxylate symporter
MKKPALHWQIIFAMVAGAILGVLSALFGWSRFCSDWIRPFGVIFINLLKLIAIPLILASLIKGISSLSDIAKLSRIGIKTVVLYLCTTVVAVTVGLVLVNTIAPGRTFTEEKRLQFREQYAAKALERKGQAEDVARQGPLQLLVDSVPDNVFRSMTDNAKMLQVIFFAVLFGVALVLVPASKAKPVMDVVDGLNEVILKIVSLVMLAAPLGVFALLASLVADFAGDNPREAIGLFHALGLYAVTVVAGLLVMVLAVYPLMLKYLAHMPCGRFYRGIGPAQMLAFSTSSSAAALPVTMERCETQLGISREVSSFVLPLGATINMDGTSLYQAVAAVFIAQAFGVGLDLGDQLTIVLTATLASIGAAAVPGAGMVMLMIVLQAIHVDSEGIALIFAVDRILDMCRTVVNVTGDATVASVVFRSEQRRMAAGTCKGRDPGVCTGGTD